MNPALTHIHTTLKNIQKEVQKDIIGQDALIEKLLITIFSGGHALLEGVPGLGKTKTIRTIANVLGLPSKRVSFTPDLLPSDLTGAQIYKPGKGEFSIRKGPIFTNILLADEINRTPPKVQSALLEAMEEKQVTIAEETLSLPLPFIVFATQNSLEYEGTYPLPEAQLDRFLMKILLSYPSKSAETQIFLQESIPPEQRDTKEYTADGKESSKAKKGEVTASETTILSEDFQEIVGYIAKNIRVDTKIYDYISDILEALRALTFEENPFGTTFCEAFGKKTSSTSFQAPFALLSYGPSTRAGLALIKTARVRALLKGRDFVLPEDIKALAHDILDHRIGLSYEALSERIPQATLTDAVLNFIKIP